MACVLGGITIPSSIVWTDRKSSPPVTQTRRITLGGKSVFYPQQLVAGMPITLASLEDQGCVYLDVADQLYELSMAPGAQYTLAIEGKTFNVLFRHEDPPAFTMEPIIARSTPLAGDLFRVTIKLITV